MVGYLEYEGLLVTEMGFVEVREGGLELEVGVVLF